MISTKKSICVPRSVVSSSVCALEAHCKLANSDWELGEIRETFHQTWLEEWRWWWQMKGRNMPPLNLPSLNSTRPPIFSVISSVLLPTFLCLSSTSPCWIIICLKSRPCEDHLSNNYTTIKNKALLKDPAADWRRLQVRKGSEYSFSYSALPPNSKRSLCSCR